MSQLKPLAKVFEGRKPLREVVFNSLLLNILMNLFLYVGQLLIARTLLRNDYAVFVVVINFVALIALFADLGLTPLFVRMFAEAEENIQSNKPDRRGKLLGSMLCLRIIMSVAVSLAVVFIAPLLGYSEETVYLMGIFLTSLLISSRLLIVRSIGEALLRGQGKYILSTIFTTIDAFTFAIILFIIRGKNTDIETIVWVYTFCNLPGFIALTISIYRWVKKNNIHISVDRSILLYIAREGIPLALGTAFLTVHNTADPLLLDKLSNPQEVSAFGAALRVQSALIFLPAVFALVIAPEVTRNLLKNKISEVRKLVSRSLEVLLICSITFALTLTAAPHLIVQVLFGGDKYIDAAPLIIVLGWTFIGTAVTYFTIEVAIAEGKQWISMLYMGTIMVFSVAGDLFLIPQYGAYGASIARCCAVAVGTLVVGISSLKMATFSWDIQIKSISKIIFSSVIALASYSIMHSFQLHEIVIAVGVLVVYFITLILTKALHVRNINSLVFVFTNNQNQDSP